MKPINTVMEEIKNMPACPRSGEANLYFLLLEQKDKHHKNKK